MGLNWSSPQLGGMVNSGTPTISYAYNPTNTLSFGFAETALINAVGSATGASGSATAFLVPPNPTATPTINCGTFPIYPLGGRQIWTLHCPIAATKMLPGQYTFSISQYSHTLSVLPYGGIYYYPTVNTIPTALGDLTFSIVPPAPTTTIVQTTTAPGATQTSGISEILPTNTIILPSASTSVTVYQTTIVSITTSTSTLTGVTSITDSSSGATASPSTCPAFATPKSCSKDNCFNALKNKLSAGAASFCSSFLSAPATCSVTIPATALPTYASACSYLPSRISSACACLATTTTALAARGYVAPTDAPPDYTYSPGGYTTVTKYVSTLVTQAAVTVPSSTKIDAPSSLTSGVTTSTVSISATVTVTTVLTVVTSQITVTIPASTITVSASPTCKC